MLYLYTGGAACGKSHSAEAFSERFQGVRYYIATMKPYGIDSQEKIAKHRAMRAGKGYETIECYGNLDKVKLPQHANLVLLECITNLVADELYDDNGIEQPADEVTRRVIEGIENIASQCDELVIITNEVGCDGIGYAKETQDYVRLLGKINCMLAARCDAVFEMTAGYAYLVKVPIYDLSHMGIDLEGSFE